ncbi:MAG: hypothetical protein HY669_00640 [Chloroflexi bacterium]|nr:hypothetical protein [Chloroflexota bacterium]
MSYDQRYMVKQRLGQITGEHAELAVYTTGVPGWFLFRVLREISPGTFVETEIEIAHKGSDLKPGWRAKLH